MTDLPQAPSSGFFAGRKVSRGESPASIANIANIVTVVRILLAPLFIWMLLADDGQYGVVRYLAAALFVFAIVTDTVDGHLARGRNLVTPLGIILDPIADKILIGGAIVALSILGELPWWITVAVLVREFGITIFRFAVLSKVIIPASRGGKLKTVVQAVAIALFLVAPWTFLGAWAGWLSWVVMGGAIALTLYTGFEYLWQARRHSKLPNARS
ncbi:CDP-diacylglycerol--glycerol-3-phosphate 3-phosphatidyltransferase [Salinibacterium sp. G-O1]|uniref:CDP-diacylglycerol--glycerol-3-phosphate 3-phosphatidyltransferase n=1 Tax=Salinibacterium sp. G-O1 TaxID=3046208 RepID=UPI0024BB233B|nr:CDP-diacylglycerol--glycerol-3-phosphate 3-phosphatidyltransferase [Salinibacterium sp. G-O1]MDJ0334802.1 CDP-diacylglycerol--glycerol-3-phosphate 3-phosphatidyltransferase [Salinibacterium sp. G-O1]